MTYFGHVLSSEGIIVDPQKVEVVNKWAKPTTPTDIRIFLYLARYYRRFMETFCSIAALLTKLTQKGKCLWGSLRS